MILFLVLFFCFAFVTPPLPLLLHAAYIFAKAPFGTEGEGIALSLPLANKTFFLFLKKSKLQTFVVTLPTVSPLSLLPLAGTRKGGGWVKAAIEPRGAYFRVNGQ